jgi:polysaccharide biosynthesis/export protein
MRLLRLAILILFAIYFSSCHTQHKVPINYIDNADSSINNTVQWPEIKIQKNDLLSIQVYSASLDPATDAPYNLPGGSSTTASASATAGSVTPAASGASGFLVDENGNIEYPRFGTIHVDGLTKSQLADSIKAKLTTPVELLKSPSVIIRFLNFKVTVLGEVNHPGPIIIPNGHITILEAIGLAGDIPITGVKSTVRILRESNGKREVGYVDLTSKEIFNSNYYNLLQNDVVFVQPTKAKVRQSDQLTLQRITTVLGIITSLTLIYNIINR